MTWVDDRPLRFGRSKTRRFVELVDSVYGNHMHTPALFGAADRAEIETGAIPAGGPSFLLTNVMMAAASQGKLLAFIAEIVCDKYSDGIHEDVWSLLDTDTARKIQFIILKSNPSFLKKSRLENGFFYEINGGIDAGNFQRIINEFALFHNPAEFRYKMAECEAKVVRVDIDNIGQGTGFLVGPDLILTNYHVVAPALDNSNSITVLCDYKYVPRNGGRLLEPGRRISMVDDGLIAVSKHQSKRMEFSESGVGILTPASLDFALLKLAEPIGSQGLGDNGSGDEKRGWHQLPTVPYNFRPEAGLFVMGHPQLEGDAEAEALKLALSLPSRAELTPTGQRLRYGVNTAGGNSGSPVLNQRFEPIALHHAGFEGQPRWADGEKWSKGFNQGIPLSLIVAEIKRQIESHEVLGSMGFI